MSKMTSVRDRLKPLVSRWYVPGPTPAHFEAIRRYELEVVLRLLPPQGRVLEIGAGTGWQARVLSERGYVVDAIEIASSTYRAERIWPIVEYDGHALPFDDNTFDIVFSSNVLEHVPHVREFQQEIRRTLKANGRVVHVLPSPTWRFWTNLTHVLKCWALPETHGAHAPGPLAEIRYFGRKWWSQLFRDTGWVVESCHSNELFYTGHFILDSRLTLATRRKMSRILGGSGNVFVLRAEGDAQRVK